MKNHMDMLQRSPDSGNTTGNNNGKEGLKLEDISVFKKKDFYARLAVHPEADAEDVQKAYRRKSMQYHPDGKSEELLKNYGEIMQLVNEAYETLSDGEKRKKYDVILSGKPTQSHEVQNTPKLSEQEIEDKVKTFASTCDKRLEEHGSSKGMDRIIFIMKNYIRLGVPEQRLSQVIMPSMKKYYIKFAETELTKKSISSGSFAFVTAPERLEALSIVHDFKRFITSPDITPVFKKLLKKEMITDYYKKYLLSVRRDDRTAAMHRSRKSIMELSDNISEAELKSIEDQVRFK